VRRLRVLTWNVGRFYTPTHNNRLDDHDIPQVAAVLHELDADVVLLQELVDVLQLRAILARTHQEYAGALAEDCDYDRKCAALVKKRLEPRFEQHTLAPSRRGTVLARLGVNGVRLTAASVHFDVFDRQRRRSQARALAAITDACDDEVVLVAGDLNYDPRWGRDLLDREMWSVLTERLDDAGRDLGPTLLGMMRIDHVLMRGATGRARVVPQRRLPLGDHDAVVCDLDIDARRRNP
jgi:endonuclease/exonuclease/phosphatase family metal-dependent hydrolase